MSNQPLPAEKVISLLMHYCFANASIYAIGTAHGVTGACVCKYARLYNLPPRWTREAPARSSSRSTLYAGKNWTGRQRPRTWHAAP